MAFYLALDDTAGNRVATVWLGHLDRSYVVTDGWCPLYQQIGWCWSCHTCVAAERLRDPADIDADEARVINEHGWFEDTLRGPNDVQPWLIASKNQRFAERIAGFARERAWRRARRSPPRCLECGRRRSIQSGKAFTTVTL